MPKTTFAKQFEDLLEDFNVATQRAIATLAKTDDSVEMDDDELLEGNLERLYVRVKKDCQFVDREGKDLDAVRKHLLNEKSQQTVATNAAQVEKENKELLKGFKHAAESLEKSLEAYTLKVRSQLGARKDLGAPFTRAANAYFLELKKLDVEVDKVVATELKRKPKEVKKAEVIPSNFLADFQGRLKRYPIESDDAKLKKDVKEAEERLKRCDTNGDFDKVESLCEVAATTLKTLIKDLGKDGGRLTDELKSLIAAIDKYDNHMFLLGKGR